MPTQLAKCTPLGHAFWSTNASTAKSFATATTSGTASTVGVLKVYVSADTAIRFYLDRTSPSQNEGFPLAANTVFVVDTDPGGFRFITQGAVGNVYAEFVGA